MAQTGMSDEEMEQALEHDAAQKEAASRARPAAPLASIEVDLAVLAKACSSVFTDVAKMCGARLLNVVEKEGLGSGDEVAMLLEMAERSAKLAREFDAIGDQVVARQE